MCKILSKSSSIACNVDAEMLRHGNISALFVQKAPQDISLTPSADVGAAGPVDQQHVLERCAPVVGRMKQQTVDSDSPKLDEKALFVTTRSFLQFSATLTIGQMLRCAVSVQDSLSVSFQTEAAGAGGGRRRAGQERSAAAETQSEEEAG